LSAAKSIEPTGAWGRRWVKFTIVPENLIFCMKLKINLSWHMFHETASCTIFNYKRNEELKNYKFHE
jgi:hypothetical protein